MDKDGHIGAINAVAKYYLTLNLKTLNTSTHQRSPFLYLKKGWALCSFNENHIQLSPFSYNNIWSHSDKIFALNKSTLPEFIRIKNPKFIPYIS